MFHLCLKRIVRMFFLIVLTGGKQIIYSCTHIAIINNAICRSEREVRIWLLNVLVSKYRILTSHDYWCIQPRCIFLFSKRNSTRFQSQEIDLFFVLNSQEWTSYYRTDDIFGSMLEKIIYQELFCRGNFFLPNGPETFNDAFKAHMPSKVHYKVYPIVLKMPDILSFKLVPTHEVWMEIFPGYIPDRDDIGLYFFPIFKKRFTSQL